MRLAIRNNYYNPFSELERLHDEINCLFDFSFGGFPERQTGLLETGWAPAVDVYDSKDNVLVKADLPGLNKDDIDITIQDNTLILKGEKKHEAEINEDGYVRTERFCGTFQRAISLPSDVDASGVRASYKDGTLELTLPKKEEAKPKQISVDIQ